MGACMSSNTEELEMKKRSQMIDKKLEEDSRRLRRECKILLLGTIRYRFIGKEANIKKVLEKVGSPQLSSR
jgi:hypothetical protein